MKVLIVGGGGREHALAWKAAQSPLAEKVFVAPGNAGTAMEPGLENIDISADDIGALLDFARDHAIDLTIVGPEAALVAGIVDIFRQQGVRCFGPDSAAAILEGSKSFTKEFLRRHNIPTAAYAVFTDVQPAIDYIQTMATPVVIKADGLAAGKGVIIAHTKTDAIETVRDMLAKNRFGDAGHRVVIEEFLQGEEASFIVMSDGEHILPLASSQDYKARDDGDKGPNTGGMGAYSPAPVITGEINDRILHEVIEPTVRGMAKENRRYTGFLYAGIMITEDGTPNVLEFNCRFGDPETQPIMMRLRSDLVLLCNAAVDGKLDTVKAGWDERAALGIVLASRGYPASASKGDIITGLDISLPEHVKIFHAGTRQENNHVVTAGGRVLCVTALGDNVTDARNNAWEVVQKIHWDGMFCRSDIGYRAINREMTN
ncbi:MAG TPA: phosphoribosylamine--glycine ligase [Gammaproteobacteria bacterium]|nr:phosphoribosylamine--glycine ligase [Gammaproteobacteria bacterium]